MKKLILSAAVIFALSASTGLSAQDQKKDTSKAKTECCSKKKECGEKKSCCSKEKAKECKSSCNSKETPKKEDKKQENKK